MASQALSENANPNRIQPLLNGMGSSKDRTKDFLNIKNKINMIRDPSLRFKPTTNVIAFDSFNVQKTTANSNQSSTVDQIGKGGPSNKYVQFDNNNLGHGKNELPPLWVDIQESIEDKISEVESQFNKLQQLRNQRFKPRFDEDENKRLDREIDEIISTLTDNLKKSEKDLRLMMQENFENDTDQQIRKNIQQTYLFKLQEITRQLRQMEKEHLMRIKDLYGEEGEIIIDQIEKREKDFFAELDQKQNRDLVQLEQIGEIADTRQGQITKLVTQINDLAILFKELSILVVEQGTVLDRIDYNIQEAHKNVKKGNVELTKTLKREKSWRARGCMSCQITGIVICTILLVLKHVEF